MAGKCPQCWYALAATGEPPERDDRRGIGLFDDFDDLIAQWPLRLIGFALTLAVAVVAALYQPPTI